MSKKVNKLTEPNMRLYFLLAAVFCAVTLWIEPILGLVEAGVMALTYVYFRRTAQKRREGIQRYVEDMTDDVASAGKSSMLSAPFAMMVFRPDTQEVLWSNESFLQLTGMRENLFDNRLEDTLPGFPAQRLLKPLCTEQLFLKTRMALPRVRQSHASERPQRCARTSRVDLLDGRDRAGRAQEKERGEPPHRGRAHAR